MINAQANFGSLQVSVGVPQLGVGHFDPGVLGSENNFKIYKALRGLRGGKQTPPWDFARPTGR